MSDLVVPARKIPVPTSISPEAQGVLAMGVLGGDVEYPDRDDVDGWHAWVAAQDAVVTTMLGPQASAIVAAREGREIGDAVVYVVTPETVEDDDRVVLDIHGGAFILQGGDACAAMTVIAAARLGLRTWGVDYRMPPDHPYPVPLDDCMTAYRALLDDVQADRIIVSGGSAGGNLAAAVIVRARDEGLALPAAVVLSTPEVDLTESGDSFHTNLGVDTILGSLEAVNELYAAGHDLTDPYLSPLFADLTGFPPTILITGTRDLFLSNTVRMHRKLRSAGVDAQLHVLEAAPHGGFLGMAPEDAEIASEVRRFIDERCARRSN